MELQNIIQINYLAKIYIKIMKPVVFKDPEKLYFTSDLHLGHGNIIKFCNRPFVDVNEMNNTIINNWNKVIKEDDLCFILGDFSMWGRQSWENLLDRMLGRKILIIGNHDKEKTIPVERFEYVTDGFLNISIDDKDTKFKEQLITLCHYPMLSWYQSHRGAWQLFGHWHNKKINAPTENNENIMEANLEVADYVKEEFVYMSKTRPTQMDIGVDGNDFRPISYYDIKKIINERISKGVYR